MNKLKILNNGINQSPARKSIPLDDNANAFNNQLQLIATQIEQEKIEMAQANAKPEPAVPSQSPSPEKNSALSAISQKLKAKSRELSEKGKAKMEQSKAELDEYLGRTLPERTISLEFILPITKSKKDIETNFQEKEIEKLFSAKNKAIASMLEIADRELITLSKAPVSNSKRIALLNAYTPLLSEKIKSLISMFERKPCNFDDKKRATMVDHGCSALKHLITGYKQVYADVYESANIIYGPQRKTANLIAFQIMDLLYLEQLLTTSLHLPVPTGAIKTVNKIVYILSLYEPEALSHLHPSVSLENSSSVEELFIAFHLLNKLDRHTLSSGLHKHLKQYLNQHRKLVSTIPLTVTQRLDHCEPGQQLWCAAHDQEYLTQLNHTDALTPDNSMIYLQVQAFFNQVKQDYITCLKFRMHNKQQNITSLAGASTEQALLLMSKLNQSIIALEKTPKQIFTVFINQSNLEHLVA
ncbi:hypothetical protein [Oceanicoccus sp. KOV_DT_Chl]|uniref:hypothetical protein n=1 Tax=Oceanicoccus sp. KOV_DT_Chl TaxID=1904639 RepID=UPI000C798071|nr:hypothetical protein [Oceanicoccus sp. KOV_DT_Chl]